MKKFWQLAASATLALSMLVACGTEKETQQKEGAVVVEENNETVFPVTAVDALGNEITLEEAPDRIVSLTPSNTEILFGLGLDEEIVGVNDNDNYPEQVADKTRVGGIEYNVETIVSLQPDIVFAHESSMFSSEGAIAQLEASGITVFVVDNAETFEETYDTIEVVGTLTGKEDEAEEVISSIKTKLSDIEAKLEGVEPKTAFMVVGGAPNIYVVGQNTFMNEMLKFIHVENAVKEEGWPMYSPEQFLAANPDSIIFTYEGDDVTIKNNPAFANMTAVKNNALTVVDGNTTSRQGPRIADGVESIAKAIYPEVFND
ncbi:ABC transporter substrate-binding protein [Lysinibacillus sp. KU-BSD001]|uniref:ABC transporter substrate-binding protein n=1 Tax=Lysinibacillus sp. KU-BSD001 TaxID=3141328 RepID=UPI0036E92B2D